MGMVSEQVKELRKTAREYKEIPFNDFSHSTCRILEQAADTIEALSAKLQVANDGGGWIMCKDSLPNDGDKVFLQDYYGEIEIGRFGHNEMYQEGFYSGDWFTTANNYLAWQPLPSLYQG